jgi:hypothetical protein
VTSTAPSTASLGHARRKQSPARISRFCHRHHRGLLAALIILLFEAFVFNLSFWTSLGAPTALDLPAGSVSVASGLAPSKIADVVTVTNPGKSYVTVNLPHNDASIPITSLRLTPTSAQPADRTDKTDTRYTAAAPDFEKWATVRIDMQTAGSHQWIKGNAQSYSAAAPSSTYLQIPRTTRVAKIRVWFLQPEQSSFAYAGLSVNVRPAFSINVFRVAIMALIAAFLLGFRPGSRLYRTRLDTGSRSQRGILTAFIVAFLAVLGAVAFSQSGYKPLSEWSTNGDYTYDFDQYARLGDSLLRGLPWLDLPVPDALAHASNPYSTQVRAQLLSQGVTPIFWDHAFWNDHWYCYFGVLPAVVFYVPFQAITSLWIPGGAFLPTTFVVVLLLGLFALTATLLAVRVMVRHFPSTSLGMALLSILGFLSAANLFFLAFRLNFYAVPMLSSLVLTMLGLWLWLGARRVTNGHRAPQAARDAKRHLPSHMWTVSDGAPQQLLEGKGATPGSVWISKPRVGFGFLCMAANLGCRPTFVLAALLAFVVFWPEIRTGRFFSYLNPRAWRKHSLRPLSSLGNDAAALLPAIAICLPVLAYNFWRFGSLLNFGNDYQLTVTDLTTYKEPVSLVAPITYYYLFQPLHLSAHFPFLTLTQTPLSSWQLTEPHAGGFFWLVPFALLGIVAALMRSRLRHLHMWGFVLSLLGVGAIECLFDAYKAGLSWRYMADFGWCVGLAAVAGACALEEWARQRVERSASERVSLSMEPRESETSASGTNGTRAVALKNVTVHTSKAVTFARSGVAALVGVGLVIAALTFLMPGRIDNLMANAPQIFFEIRGWFTAWTQWV